MIVIQSNKRASLLLLLFSTLQVACFGQKKLLFQDAVYEEQVKTVMVSPAGAGTRNNLLPAAVPLQQQNLVLEFDDIQESKNNYYVKLIHCNFDWSKSTLMDLDFMKEYNEFPINTYDFSVNTHLPYVHYQFNIPVVKISGNYLLIVYREGDKSDLIISKRIMVYDNQANVYTTNQLAGMGTLSATNQQINFTVSYTQLEWLNPLENVHVVIRQNQRWDNARMDVKPSFLRDDLSQMEYRFFDQDKQWAAGNEFRFVDFRSLNFPGQNTAQLNRNRKPFELYVRQDLPRTDQAYAQYRDLNGNYAVENQDYNDPDISSQYLFVNFSLRSAKLPGGDVYVLGAFNQWSRNEENRMTYNSAASAYEASIVLKQGWYDYQYWVESNELPAYHIEGSHFQTENFYDVMVYYRAFRPNADLLVGYYSIPVNAR